MSYARKGPHSDVYVLASGFGIECEGCTLPKRGLPPPYNVIATCAHAMLAHLARHARAGHKVPVACLTRLRAEAREADACITR